MHGNLPAKPCGPTDPEAFTGIPIMHTPSYADVLCPKCHGHGSWNIMLNAGGPSRNLTQDCDRCNGDGWIESNGEVHVPDIILINGKPHWVQVLLKK